MKTSDLKLTVKEVKDHYLAGGIFCGHICSRCGKFANVKTNQADWDCDCGSYNSIITDLKPNHTGYIYFVNVFENPHFGISASELENIKNTMNFRVDFSYEDYDY